MAIAIRTAAGQTDHGYLSEVYQLVYSVETFMLPFSYATCSENHGQLVMWSHQRSAVVKRTVEEVSRVTYADLVLDPAPLRLITLEGIVAEIRAD